LRALILITEPAKISIPAIFPAAAVIRQVSRARHDTSREREREREREKGREREKRRGRNGSR